MILRAPRNCLNFWHMLYLCNLTYAAPTLMFNHFFNWEMHFSICWLMASSTTQACRPHHQNTADNFLYLFSFTFLWISIILPAPMPAGFRMQWLSKTKTTTQSIYPISRSEFEAGCFRIQVRDPATWACFSRTIFYNKLTGHRVKNT